MRALIFGDVHVGSGKDRIADHAAVLAEVQRVAYHEEVDCLIFAGDATDHRSVVQEVAIFQDFLDSVNVPILLIPGNHDRSTMDAPSTVEIAARGFTHARVSKLPEVVVMPSVRGQALSIVTLPWAPTSAISAMHESGNAHDVALSSEETLMEIARGFLGVAKYERPDLPVMLLGHWSASSAHTPSGQLVDEFVEPVLSTPELAEMGFDLVALGHIHTAGILNPHSTCPVFYTGSTCVHDWGEADTRHGVWILDTDLTDLQLDKLRFVPIADRPFVTVAYVTDGDGLVYEQGRPIEGAYVRVVYGATAEQEARIDHESIKRELLEMGAFRVTGIHASITSGGSARTAVTEEVDVDQAFGMWLDSQEFEASRDDVLAVHTEIREAVR